MRMSLMGCGPGNISGGPQDINKWNKNSFIFILFSWLWQDWATSQSGPVHIQAHPQLRPRVTYALAQIWPRSLETKDCFSANVTVLDVFSSPPPPPVRLTVRAGCNHTCECWGSSLRTITSCLTSYHGSCDEEARPFPHLYCTHSLIITGGWFEVNWLYGLTVTETVKSPRLSHIY